MKLVRVCGVLVFMLQRCVFGLTWIIGHGVVGGDGLVRGFVGEDGGYLFIYFILFYYHFFLGFMFVDYNQSAICLL